MKPEDRQIIPNAMAELFLEEQLGQDHFSLCDAIKNVL